MAAGDRGADLRVGALDLVAHRLADVVQQRGAPRRLDRRAELAGDQRRRGSRTRRGGRGRSGRSSCGTAAGRAARAAAGSSPLHARLRAPRARPPRRSVVSISALRVLVGLLDRAPVDPPVGDQPLQRERGRSRGGHRRSSRAGRRSGVSSMITSTPVSCLERPDVASVAADDPALHLVARAARPGESSSRSRGAAQAAASRPRGCCGPGARPRASSRSSISTQPQRRPDGGPRSPPRRAAAAWPARPSGPRCARARGAGRAWRASAPPSAGRGCARGRRAPAARRSRSARWTSSDSVSRSACSSIRAISSRLALSSAAARARRRVLGRLAGARSSTAAIPEPQRARLHRLLSRPSAGSFAFHQRDRDAAGRPAAPETLTWLSDRPARALRAGDATSRRLGALEGSS